ncbi:Uncharacterised protein [Chromobacterium violaceum]|uniref:Uncharacterized protein n=1 Tax=Chromobacterium violaceum TaxID=536 RepID=A0A3S4LKT4_CHRVL|nr:Uncharacterised protein [Chromobacterium violaceum]
MQPRLVKRRGMMASERFSSPGLCMRPITAWPSAWMVIWVKARLIEPSASRHSRHRPATANGAPSAMLIFVRTARPLS